MLIQNTKGVTPLSLKRMKTEVGRTASAGTYDRVELSANQFTQEERFARELAGRVSHEIRTQQNDEVSSLQQQVQQGEYQYSIEDLAARIALFGGAVS